MKTIRPATLLLALLSTAALAAPPPAADSAPEPGAMTDAERSELVDLLERSRSELEALAARADGDAWTWKPAPDRWSVGEVVEHLVLAEKGIFETALGALDGEEDPQWEAVAGGATVEGLVANLGDRTRKFQAPDVFQPKNEMSRRELLERFAALRTTTLDYVRRTRAPLKRYTATSLPGTMNAHQWLALVGAHNLRHNLQILEVLEAMESGDDG